MIVPPILVSKLCPFDFFKHSCTRHNSVTVRDSVMQLYKECVLRQDDELRITTVVFGYCQRYVPLIVFFMLILYIQILCMT